ncbi:microsomal dipeptidase-like Zn-dependent dipeptidase [Rhodoligotrophos appendicifer]|uniref:dipeptidase n=1 Tax=Rhodoligotrophos appendicifer TaxID=987056 RepID=UPI001FE81FB2|nr:membrane dipeptidase [Rhodoligotrophos appendicifer]
MLFVDGLNCSRFDREVFEELRDGGMSCITTCLGFWEDTLESMDALGRFRDIVQANADLVAIARSGAEAESIIASGRCALIVGYQNTNALAGRLRFAEMFAEMGVRVMQLTYNNQNEYGGSCYEPNDSGISRAGRELVLEMNRVGILIDLSHVGERTSRDVIAVSEKPVAVTHANPSALIPHVRNKSNALMTELAAKGGVIGLATYANICGDYTATAEKWSEIVAFAADVISVEHIAIGTDHGRNIGMPELEWMRMGRWSRVTNFGAGNAARPGKVPEPAWLQSMRGFGNIADALQRRGFSTADVEAIMGGNWIRLYKQVFDQSALAAPASAKAA